MKGVWFLLLIISLTFAKEPQPTEKSVVERKLVSTKVSIGSILKESHKYCESTAATKQFENPSLIFVTPWNNHGYDVAKIFSKKFDFVSPTWYSISTIRDEATGGAGLRLIGAQDVDQGWITDVRNANGGNGPKIVPRFNLEEFPKEWLFAIAGDENAHQQFIQLIIAEVQKQGYDGIVFEMGYMGMRGNEEQEDHLIHLFSEIGKILHKLKLTFIMVQPAERGGSGLFTAKDIARLGDDVDYYSLMTYDFAPNRVGPNSPLPWVEKAISSLITPESRKYSHKIMLGIPFYGYTWDEQGKNAEAVLATTFFDLVKQSKSTLTWDEKSHEHFLKYDGGQRTVYYPTLQVLFKLKVSS
eukprot:TRINITY_DN4561_c0_g1_i2.p1 TRINITY_DN4561_c0_g1~~TRINITY_DN4561_c0_g1_i2.p1  ORF type:complete len:356 (+),score=101.84 TRINITY_DN4561_c0_g1_i2:106-1173(+)